ncbi:flavin reductase family protein [Streptomyces mexicanus]|uniref:flavin reductase family protein n=1 Tax=Streptomyces mexicanus TaxID=178566 RepID=UPI0036C7F25C
MIVDAADLDANAAYKLLIGSIVRRAVAWVSTVSSDGVANLAPISFFTAVGREPPLVSLTLQPRSDGVTLKDTLINIRESGEFVTNLATLPLAHAMHSSAFEFDAAVDEFHALQLEKEPSEVVSAPRVKGAPISFECVVDRIIPVNEVGDHVVWGEVVRFHVADELHLDRGRIDTAAVPAVGRLAAEYTLVDNVFTTPLDEELLAARDGRRMQRPDARPADFSPIDSRDWSPSGATSVPGA